jgi:hypothetical protein
LPQRHQDSKKHKAQLKIYTEKLINNIEISILIRITGFMGLFFVQPLCLRALVAKLFLLPQRHQGSKKHKAQLKIYTEKLIIH